MPVVVSVSVVVALACASALLASLLPRYCIPTSSLVSWPPAVLGSIMFLAFASKGATYYIWLVVGIGSFVSSAISAFFSARVVLRRAQSNREFESGPLATWPSAQSSPIQSHSLPFASAPRAPCPRHRKDPAPSPQRRW